MKKINPLKKRQDNLKAEISENFNLLIGSVSKSPSMSFYNLTTKISGKTVTRYVRKDLIQKVKQMTKRHKKIRSLIQKLSEVNWKLMQLETQ